MKQSMSGSHPGNAMNRRNFSNPKSNIEPSRIGKRASKQINININKRKKRTAHSTIEPDRLAERSSKQTNHAIAKRKKKK
ncbi:MAG: hypothetical protein FVQ77_05740 [Cytophagales bacterium]|nr:hypothetical protein [Cytophagales bacterium]